MEHNDDEILATGTRSRGPLPTNPSVVGWGGAALILSIASIIVNVSPMVLGASFMAKFFAVVVGTILGLVGALLGDAIRRFAHPDAVFTRGGIGSLIWLKIFWSIGPQVVGLAIGVFSGIGLVLG